jgi:predicted PurR-regulated permease PerM
VANGFKSILIILLQRNTMTTTSNNNLVNPQRLRQMSFFFLLVFLFVFLFLQMTTFLPAFLGAITFYMILRNPMEKLVTKYKWKKGLAAGFLLFISFLIVLVPIWVLVNMLSGRIGEVLQNSDKIMNAINHTITNLEQKFDINLMSSADTGKVTSALAASLPRILGATFNTVTSILILYFILYFMLVANKKLEAWVYNFLPLQDKNVEFMGTEFRSLVISNALGIPLVAILQGVVGLICYLFLGVNDVWFWFVFTCIASMIPFVGAALAYIPLALILFSQNENIKGIIMLVYGFGVIGTVDNVFRFMLQKKMGDVHPLITVFGVIIGIGLFGFIGLIFGPILISMFILLVKIYMNEFVERRTPTEEQLKT